MVKKIVKAKSRPYNPSTCQAIVDACSGNSGKSDMLIQAPY